MSHTPGPWSAQIFSDNTFRVVDKRALSFSNSRVCDVQSWSDASRGPSRNQARANAHLIAAAPDLLEALEAFDATIEYQYSGSREAMSALQDAAFKAKAAIDKARGRCGT